MLKELRGKRLKLKSYSIEGESKGIRLAMLSAHGDGWMVSAGKGGECPGVSQ